MAQYKVLQDIEAEDKLLGPLSLRQFIYAVIVVVLGFVAYRLILVKWFLVIPFLPPMIFFGLLAAPLGGQQSSEVWLLGKIRFLLYPRRRIWDQDGIQDLVTITAPKQVEQHLTKEFSQDEVKSRLKALSTTLDTRGWAVKDAVSGQYAQPTAGQSTDRLIDISNLPQSVPSVEIKGSDDVLDPTANPVAQQMDAMIAHSEQEHHQELVNKVHTLAAAQQAVPVPTPVATKTMTPQQAAPAVPTAQPQSTPTAPQQAAPAPASVAPPAPAAPVIVNDQKAQAPMTDSGKPDILDGVKQGAKSPDSISLHDDKNASGGEVVISLH